MNPGITHSAIPVQPVPRKIPLAPRRTSTYNTHMAPPVSNNSAVARLSTTHEAVMNWLLQNPERSLRECADTFGYTQAWLSRLIHSDIFQARLRERQDAVFLHVAQDIPAKLRGLADIAIEKVSEMIAETESPELAVDVFDKVMHRLGYAPASTRNSPPAPTQTNVFVVSPADLASAREVVVAGAVHENTSPQLTMGEVQSLPSPGFEDFAPARQEASGGEV